MFSEDEILVAMQSKHGLVAAVHDAGHEIAGKYIAGGAAAKVNDVVVVEGVSVTITKSKHVVIGVANGDTREDLVGRLCQAMRVLVTEVNADVGDGQMAVATRVPTWGHTPDNEMMQVDPFTGIVFGIAKYTKFRQVIYHVGLAWGVAPLGQRVAA